MTDQEIVDTMAGAADLGELVHDGDRVGVRFERFYPHPIDRVWRALTDSDQLRYWMPCDIVGERRTGAAIQLPFWAAEVEKYEIDEPVLTGVIEAWQPPTRFGWTWDGDVLLWELAEVVDTDRPGTRLVFTTWPNDPDLAGIVRTSSGYHVCLAELAILLDTGSAPPKTEVDAVVFRLEEGYKQRFGLS